MPEKIKTIEEEIQTRLGELQGEIVNQQSLSYFHWKNLDEAEKKIQQIAVTIAELKKQLEIEEQKKAAARSNRR